MVGQYKKEKVKKILVGNTYEITIAGKGVDSLDLSYGKNIRFGITCI